MLADDNSRCCWGGVLRGDSSTCRIDYMRTMGSRQSKTVLKDKFCETCKLYGIKVPTNRVATLAEDLETVFKNSRSGGVWTTDASGSHFRVVNNSARDCLKPYLVVFGDVMPPGQQHELALSSTEVRPLGIVPYPWRRGNGTPTSTFSFRFPTTR